MRFSSRQRTDNRSKSSKFLASVPMGSVVMVRVKIVKISTLLSKIREMSCNFQERTVY